jgi:hypothetical protein
MQIIIFLISAAVMGVIAWKKGFTPWLWILAGGVPGLIVLVFIPSAGAGGLDDVTRQRRRKAGNLVGALFSAMAVIFGVAVVIIVFAVKDPQSLMNYMYPSIGRFPWIYACMAGFAFTIVYWHRSPKASSWALRGVGLILISQIAGAIVPQVVAHAMLHSPMTKSQIGLAHGFVGLVLTLLTILGFAFIMVAVYSDRKPESLDSADSNASMERGGRQKQLMDPDLHGISDA